MINNAPTDLSQQVKDYKSLLPVYEKFASILDDYFRKACENAIPYAIIQTRAKTLSSFAEKAVRKAQDYPDPINQFGDLCGARIIVHTTEQVRWVSEFIERNFIILEKEDVQKRLGENQFGYLSIHYIVRIKPLHNYGINKKTQQSLIEKKVEVQVRTILQHAWSDILHDRTYKNKIELPEDIRRNAAILAALMEESDDKFSRVAERTDSYFMNYSAYMNSDQIISEIETLKNILKLESVLDKDPATALKLARLVALISENHEEIIARLEPRMDTASNTNPYLLLELGTAYCNKNLDQSKPEEYEKGKLLFERVLLECEEDNCPGVIDNTKISAIKALAHARLARYYEPLDHDMVLAHYRKALEFEPGNPYYLAESLGYCREADKKMDLPPELTLTIDKAITTCYEHARAGIELPQSYFTRGRLFLLKGDFKNAYGFYARGIHHFLDEKHFSPKNTLEREKSWLQLITNPANKVKIENIRNLMLIAQTVQGKDLATESELFKICHNRNKPNDRKIPAFKENILIIAGGASEMNHSDLSIAKRLLEIVLENFNGTIISGGTTAGIPGLVGQVTKKLKKSGQDISLIGYLPSKLPSDINISKGYDKTIQCQGEDFSADELHQSWTDLLRARKDPKSVKLIGINGGDISAMEYRLAAMLGAKTGIMMKTGREADKLVEDADWQDVPNLMFIPNDPASISLFISQEKITFSQAKEDILEDLARLVHENYMYDKLQYHPDESLRFWDVLGNNLKESNRQQVLCSVYNLAKAGFGVREAENPDPKNIEFQEDEIELLAELEHGRWNAERLLDGWQYGPVKNISRKINPSLVAWSELPDSTKKYDRDAVKKFPEILARAGMEIFRMADQQNIFHKTKEMLALKFEFTR